MEGRFVNERLCVYLPDDHMAHIIEQIDSLDRPDLSPYRTLRRPREHLEKGLFVAEGEKVVRRLLASSLEVRSLLLTPEWLERLMPLLRSYTQSPTVFVANKQLVETIVGYNLHQGIMAVGTVPAEQSIGDLLPSLRAPRFIVAMDGLVNAENVGLIVRNCAALGVQALLVGESSGSPYLRRAVRNSMGSVFSMPVIHVGHLRATLQSLARDRGFRTIGTCLQDAIPITCAVLTGDCCVVLGNEGEGISAPVLAVCTDRVKIPMMAGTDSLNVASASAVFLYEVQRQRA